MGVSEEYILVSKDDYLTIIATLHRAEAMLRLAHPEQPGEFKVVADHVQELAMLLEENVEPGSS